MRPSAPSQRPHRHDEALTYFGELAGDNSAPQHRGRGIEQALTDYVAGEARNNGLRSIEAESPAVSSAPAWEALGFTPIDHRRFTRAL